MHLMSKRVVNNFKLLSLIFQFCQVEKLALLKKTKSGTKKDAVGS